MAGGIKKKNIRRIEETLNRLEKSFKRNALLFFVDLLKPLELAAKKAFDAGRIDAFIMPGREDYIKVFREYIADVFVTGIKQADDEVKALKRRVRYDDDDHQWKRDDINPETMKWMRQWVDKFGGNYYDDVTDEVVHVLGKAYQDGASIDQTMQALSGYLVGPGYNRRRLETIARTNATTFFNQGRLESFRRNSDFVKALEFLPIIDPRTTDICESRQGLIIPIDDIEAINANLPPLHFECRSTVSPVDVYEWEEMHEDGWKSEDGKSLAEVLDWSKVKKPAKGFGGIEKALGDLAEGGIPEGKIYKEMDYADRLEDRIITKIKAEGQEINIIQYMPDKEEIEEIKKKITIVPSNQLRNSSGAEISNSNLKDKSGNSYKGFYRPETKEITMSRYPVKTSLKKRDAKGIADTFLHELGHHVHKEFFPNNKGLKKLEDIYNILLKNKKVIKIKPSVSFNEFFADLYFSYYEKTNLIDIIEEELISIDNTKDKGVLIKIFKDLMNETK